MTETKRVAITGGIGSGKSFVCQLLAERGISIYDCDAAAKRLMRTSDELRRQLTALIGPDTYINNVLNKAAVARFLLASAANAHAIDDIVHPAVADDFLKSDQEWLESAILYESGFYRRIPFDAVVCVIAPEEVRISRIMSRDGISREKAQEWMNRQWPQQEVSSRANYQIINDGNQPLLPQIERIIQSIYPESPEKPESPENP